MRMERFWQSKVTFGNESNVVRRFRAEELICGSHPRAHVRMPKPAPMVLFTIERIEENGKPLLRFETECTDVEIEVWGKFQHLTEFQAVKIPRILYQGQIVEISEISDERQSMMFQPERWAAEAVEYEPNYYALWHICDGVLAEAVLMEKNKPTAVLRNGYRVMWSESNPFVLQLFENNGVPRSIEMKPGRLGAPRAQIDNNVFVVTRVPDKNKVAQLKTPKITLEENKLKQWLLGVGATWILLASLFQFMPKAPQEETLENLPANLAKIILEAPKAVDGGNGMRGGGGVEHVASKDSRGGSGLEAQQIKANSGADEAVVKDKGALAALTKAEKVVGTGVMRALEATGKIASALSALDEGMKSGKIKAAGIPGFGASSGRGSALGVLGALGKVGSGGAGAGGVGMGGVGTKGFGGGGGGGTGNGFGTGVGSGLGKGEGLRTVAFDSDNVAVRGGLERSEVEAVIQENLSQIRFCYNRGLRNNPSMSGKVTSNFTISGDGGVKTSRIMGSTLAAGEVEDCIKTKIASWKFPLPRGGGEVVVSYPFLFKSN